MGTRNLTIVRIDGAVKVAQYGQRDGHPTGVGETVAEFIDKKMDLDRFKEKVRAAKKLTKKKADDQWVECGAEPGARLVAVDISYKHAKRFPESSRDTDADILWLIQERPPGIELNLESVKGKFMGKCDAEYAYDLDLDKETVTVWACGHRYGCYKFKDFDRFSMDSLEREINKACEKSGWPKTPKTKIKLTKEPKE